jgi:hypothetical protein
MMDAAMFIIVTGMLVVALVAGVAMMVDWLRRRARGPS